MLASLSRPAEIALRAFALALGYVAVVAGVIAAAGLADPAADRAVLLALNPDRYVPGLDEAMVLVTDFSERALALVIVAWLAGYAAVRLRPARRRQVAGAIEALGVLLGAGFASGAFWAGYELPIVFLPFGLAVTAGLWLAGESFVRCDDATLRRLCAVVGLVVLSSVLTSVFAEGFVKGVVGRPRPLADANVDWNHAVRQVHDEVVRVGYSYASGHAAGLFALVTPMAWAARRAPVKVALLAWAALHAVTRVYLAAHFPWCALMGSVLGLAVGSLVFVTLRPLFPSLGSVTPAPGRTRAG
jgi:membrane-associated phospholipid phosphatase